MAGVPMRDSRNMSHSDNEPEERPSWLYPLIIFIITAAIGAVILWLYIGPGVDDIIGGNATPTAEAEVADVTIAGRHFAIPANYIRLPAARSGGDMGEIELNALLPDLRGFMLGDDNALNDVTRSSPVVAILIKAGAPDMTDRERFDRIYARNADPAKQAFEYAGFTVTTMADNSGYAGQQVFSRDAGGDFVVILCGGDDTNNNIGGLCQREMAWGDGLTVAYAFRGGHLTSWEELDQSVKTLVGAFQAPAASP